jgi:tetratricopeptide (TPR) repeat protein
MLVSQRRYVESEPFFRRTIQIREKTSGKSHPETGDALNNLAWTYHDQGKDDEAQRLFERALTIFEEGRGSTGHGQAHALNGLAQIHAKKGENDEAEAKFLRAIEIWDTILPAGNASVLDVLKHYADLLETLGRSADLVKIKARITPLRAKVTLHEGKVSPGYRFPDPSPGIDQKLPSPGLPPIRS